MKLRDLELVRMICAEGGFSGAARKLGLTQPTLSRAIAQLEEQVGAQLFDRKDGSATPTPFGRLVADRAEPILMSVGALERELHEWINGGSGKLRIAVGGATRIKPLPQMLDFLSRSYPGVAVHVRLDAGASIAEGVARGRYDLAFSYSGNALDFGDLLRVKLFNAECRFAMRPGHPLSDNATLTHEEFLSHPLALLGVIPELRVALGRITERQERHLTSFISDDIDTICQQLMRSDYISYGPDFLFKEYIAQGKLVSLPTDWLPGYDCWMLTTFDKWKMPLVRKIADMAKLMGKTTASNITEANSDGRT